MKRILLIKLLFALYFCLLTQCTFGQVNYTFTSVGGTYTANSSPTSIHAAGVDDAISAAINLGFTFKYECSDYTQIKVSSNGWLTLNTAISSSLASNNLSSSSDRPIIAPLWDDLQVYTGGSVNYKLTGTSPNRIFTVEWKAMEWNYLASGDVISFQVKLYESTHSTSPNRIEFIYTSGATAVNSGSASVGLSGTSSGDFYSLDGTGATPSASKVTETTSLSSKPSNGRIYIWDYVPCCTPPTNPATSFTSSSLATTTMTVGWTRGNGNNVMVIAKAGSAPTDPSNGTTYTANAAYGSGTAVGGGFCVYNGSGTSVNITALTANTTYYYAIYEYNTTGTCYNLTQLTGSASTCISPVSLPQSCDFTSYTGSNLTTFFPNFSEASGTSPSGTTSSWSYETDLVTTTAYVNMYGNSADEWIIGPTFSATGTSTVNFKAALTDYNSSSPPIDGGMTGTDDKVIVRVKTCEGSWTDVYTFESSTIGSLSNSLTDFSVDLSSYNGQNITLAFYASEGTTDEGRDYNFHIDDILIENACSYPSTQATSFTSSSVNSSTMTIGWTRGNGNNVMVIAKAGSTPTDPASGTSYSANSVYGSGSAVGGGFCIYNGSGTSVNVTGLSSNTTYYYAVYEYNTAGTCYNTAQLSGNATTCMSTVALPQSCDFTSYTGANLTAFFPNFSEASGIPPSGTSSSWGSETDLTTTTAYINLFSTGDEEWIIGPSFTAAANSTIFFKAALTDYNSASPPVDGGMTGTDDKVIVRVKPCEGSWTDVYTFESSTIGSLSNTLTDFSIDLGSYSGQIVTVAFFGTDGSTDEGHDYNFHLDDINIENACSSPSTQATSFTATSVASTSMTIGWTRGNGNNVMVIAKAGSAPSDPSSGTAYTANSVYGSGSAVGGGFCVYDGAGTSVNITGLSQTTTYYFAVYEYNTSGICYRLSELSGNATTSCSLSITFPFSESFDGATFPPTCWRNTQVSATGLWARSTSGTNPTCSPNSGAGMAYFNSFTYSSGTKSNLISPPLPFSASACYTVSFWIYGVDWNYDDLDIYVNTSPTHSGATLLGSITLDDYSGWTQVTYNIPVGFSGSTSYIIFQGTSALDNNIFIDDITVAVKAIPVCATYSSPADGTTGLCGNSVTLSWNSVSGAENYKVYLDNNASPSTLVATVSTTTYNATSLSSGTQYYWKIVPTNCTGDASGCSTIWDFTMLSQTYATLPYTQDFEGPWVNRCDTRDGPDAYWRNTPATGNDSWRRDDDGAAASWSTTSGAYSPVFSSGAHSARFHAYNTYNTGNLDLYFNASAAGTKKVTFDYILNSSSSASMDVFLSTDGGLTFSSSLLSLTTASSWTNYSLDISSTSSTCVLRFRGDGDNGSYDIGLDNLNILLPCSGVPTAGTAAVNNASFCNSTSPLLSLSGYTLAGGITFQWQSSTSNSPYSWTNITNGTTTTFSAPAISQTTYYRCEVRCGSNTDYSNILTVTNTAQSITSTNTPVSIVCGNTANLTATASGGASVKWYSSLTGGSVLFTGSPYTTPAISANTTYYCAANSGSTSESGGMPSKNNTYGYLYTGYGIVFNASQSFTLVNCTVYPKKSGNITVQLQDNTGTPLWTSPSTAVNGGNSANPVVITINQAIAAANGYRLVLSAYSGTNLTDLIYDYSTSFPYTSPSGALSVSSGWNGSSTSSTNYYFYNLNISIGCESSPRTPVNVTVTGVTAPVASTYTAPANGSTGICPVSTTLTWNASTTACRAATGYKLYFGTNNPPTNIINGTDVGNVLSYNLGTLTGSTLYYWRVIPTNAGGDATGFSTWSFTTAANPGSICPGLLGTGVTSIATLPYSSGAGTTSGGVNDLTSANLVTCGNTSYYTGEDKVWYFTPATSGNITISLTSSGTYTGLTLYDGCPLAAGACGAAPGACVAYSQSSTGNKTMSACVVAGTTYYLILDSWSTPSSNPFTSLTISSPSGTLVPANDLPCNATSLILGSVVNGDNSCAASSSEPTSPGCWTTGVKNTVWYSVVAPASGQLSIRATTSGLTDTQIGLFQGACGSLTQVSPTSSSCNNDISGCGATMSSLISLTGLTSGNTYYVVVDGADDLTGTFTIQAIDPTSQSFPVTPGQDCSSTLPTCNEVLDVGDPGYANTGTQCDFDGTGNCTSGERASVWYTIDIGATGPLLFDIIPNDYDGTEGSETDYDFLLWKTAGSGTITNCSTIGSNSAQGLVACNFSALGVTGLYTGGAGNPAYNGGTPWDGSYEAPVSATIGEQYVLVVQNYTQSTSGFTVDYSASGSVVNISAVPTLVAWTGATSTTWGNAANWGGCGAPNTCATSVVIPGYMATMPLIDANTTVKDLTINPGATLAIDPSTKISICGNFVNNGTITFGAGATLEFIGTAAQTFTSSTALTIPNLIINNSNGVTLSGGSTSNITVTGTLTLTAGKLNTSDPPMIIMDAGSTVSGGSSTSFVDGPMQKVGNTAFTFPLGDGTRWARMGITAPTVSSTFKAQYFANGYSSTTPMDATQGAANLNHVSVVEYWQLDRTEGTGNTSVTLYWENASQSGIYECGSAAYLSVAKWTGSAWTNLNPSSGTYTGACNGAVSGTVKTEAALSTFSPFTFGSVRTVAQNPLPVEYLSFTGERNGNVNVLEWTTATETNNDYFVLLKSKDGIDFSELSRKNGAGNSSAKLNYSQVDHSPYDLTFYRLKQVDLNGFNKFSEIIAVKNPLQENKPQLIDLFPNPGSTEINLALFSPEEEVLELELIDIYGRTVMHKQVMVKKGQDLLKEDIQQLANGIYAVKLSFINADHSCYRQFIKN